MKKVIKKIKKFFRRFWDAYWRPEMLILPGQVSFFLFLSLVPTITLIGYFLAYLNISNDLVSTLISNVFSKDIASVITPIITSTKITPAFFITLGVGYFIASNGMASIIVASNTIYGIKDNGFFRRRLKAFLMEIVIVILMLFVLIIPLLSDSIIEILKYFNLGTSETIKVTQLFNLLNSPIAWIVIFLFIKLIYYMAPDKKISSKGVNGGALFTTICWVLVTSIYSYYINNFANYSVFYGTLANIVVLMIWIYFLAYFFVIGMAMNYHEELERTGVIDLTEIIEKEKEDKEVRKKTKKTKKKVKKSEETTE